MIRFEYERAVESRRENGGVWVNGRRIAGPVAAAAILATLVAPEFAIHALAIHGAFAILSGQQTP